MKKKLKIAILASDFIRIPPEPKYIPPGSSGAPEMVMYKITEGMVKRGHNVTLFASKDSKTSAKLFGLRNKSTSLDPEIQGGRHIDFEYALISKCFQFGNKGKYDIIHSIYDMRSAFFAQFSKVPVVSTLHSPIAGRKKYLLKYFPKTQYYISISNEQRKGLADLKYIKTIYHGIDLDKIKYSQNSKDYLMFIGRIRPEKGALEAIKIAKKLNKKIIIAGSHNPEDEYWIKKVKPEIDRKNVVYIGHVSRKKIFSLLRSAQAFIFPIQWEEPFGLVMIEAMACGTPVVAFKMGSVPEIVKNGKTGFIVKNVNEAVQALKKINTIDRKECRKQVENKFSEEKMIDEYEKVYYKILAKNK